MHATVHQIEGLPGPQDTSWLDPVLDRLGSRGAPAGTILGRPLGTGPGLAVALWTDAADADAALAGADAGTAYEIVARRAGSFAGPARYIQVSRFDGPRTAEWAAAFDRSGEERIWPAVRELPGMVETLVGAAADGGRASLTLARSVEELEALALAILSTELLPWEDPTQLTGPDSTAVLRLLHADLPLGADR